MSSKPSPKSLARKSSARASEKSASKSSPVSASKTRPKSAAKLASAATHSEESRPAPRKTARTEEAGTPTSPSELSSEVMEFINAIDTYKRSRRRPFPSWSEVFEIVKSLGYHKSA